MLTLLVLQGPDKGRRFELPDAPALVGRDSRQIAVDPDNTVSRSGFANCCLRRTGTGSSTTWAAAQPGTYVNGARVENNIELKVGDQVRVGRTLMVFGAQPGVSRTSGKNVALSGEEAGMDSAIMATLPSSEDSMVLAVPEPAAAAMGNLKILYQLGAALGSSFSVDQVLEVVMDLSFEHVKADRGMILLLDTKNNELIPKVDALFTRDDPQTKQAEPTLDGKPAVAEKIHASRTIINHVLLTGEGVLSSNAMTDQRFSKGKSVHNLGIRSALCVPIKARKLTDKGGDAVIGVIYIDSSVRNYTYAPEQLRLLTAIGLQAGMAIQNAELYTAQLQAERLSAVGETSAALSHSIKNILQALQGGADVVEMGLRGSNITQASKGWRIVHRNLDKIYGLTMNLLAYSKQREPSLEMVNPKKLIDECLELVAQVRPKQKKA